MRNSPQNVYKKVLGKVGEKTAEKYLKKQGYKIIETNYKTPLGEADIICSYKDTLIFIEVKTRSGDEFGTGKEAVTLNKQKRYVKIAQYFTVKEKLTNVNIRFDVIEIQNGEINHIISAFDA